MRKLCCAFLFLFSINFLYAQEETTTDLSDEENEILDELLGDQNVINDLLKEASKAKGLYISVDFNNKTYFSGRDIGIDQFNISPQITYVNSSGFFASLSGIYYSDFLPRWDYTATTLGYAKKFGKHKNLRWTSSYTRYFYSEGVDNPFKNALSLGVSVTNKKETLGTTLSGSHLFGDDSSFQITSTTHVAIKLFKNVKFKPSISFLIAQQTIELERIRIINGQPTIHYIQNEEFGLINAQLYLPLQLQLNGFDFELGYRINFPTALTGESDLSTTSSFNFSIAYLIGL